MSAADKDGRMAQWLGDRLACLGMEINESVAASIAAFESDHPDYQQEWKP